jgi:hypothetical protein
MNFIFQVVNPMDQNRLEHMAVVEWFDLEKRDMGIRLTFPPLDQADRHEWLDTFHAHIRLGTQNLILTHDDHLYRMVVDPHPTRATYHPMSMLVRYKIQAYTVD